MYLDLAKKYEMEFFCGSYIGAANGMPIVVLKSHGCEAVAAERADRMRVNFCAFAQKPKQQKLRGRAEVEQ